MRRIREIQKSAAAAQQNNEDEAKQQPVKALWKLSKRYDSVPSRVKQQLNNQVVTHVHLQVVT